MKKFIFLTGICWLSVISAQHINIGGFFPTIDHSGSLNDKWEYSLYYFAAFNTINPSNYFIREPHTGILYSENAITYKLNKPFSITASYVYERQNAFRNSYRNENRFYLQATYKHFLNKLTIKQRLRYDGRFIENRRDNAWPYTSRLRYLIGFGKDIGTAAKYYIAAYSEFFFNTFKASPFVYAENWAFAGVGYRFQKNNSLEVGPLYIFWVNNARYDLTNFYYLQLTWVSNISFKKDEK